MDWPSRHLVRLARQVRTVALKSLNPYFRVWTERVADVDELLDAVAELSRLPWFGNSDYGGLIRRILADTDKAAGDSLHYANNARSEHADAAGPSMLLAMPQRSRRQGRKCTQAATTTVLCGFHSGRRKVGHNNRRAGEKS